MSEDRYGVVIVGGGLAGQTLARHLLLDTDETVLLLERLEELPTRRQKVGESSVQVAGYYYSRVLDLEEHLFRRHFMKYNLRFYWPSGERDNRGFEDYTQTYIRDFSNVASYQLDRNAFEAEVMRRNLEDPRFTLRLGAGRTEVELVEDGSAEDHVVSFDHDGERRTVRARWLVDTSGRNKVMAKKLGLVRRNPIRHGATFWWVDGLVDFEKLTDRSRDERLRDPARRHYGHLPLWLATNHFCGEGYWFWVIPLHGKTSLGLVYDRSVVDPAEVRTPELATGWVCERHPLFARDLPGREVVDWASFRDFSYDCGRTISADRWAMAGESGRFTDPLYSPGSDLISIHNTLIVDAVRTGDGKALAAKARLYEQVMRAVYAAYVPSYAESYDALGDPETFSLKYCWELAVYFAFYVFPFINGLFTDRRFLVSWLRAFSKLGPVNAGVHRLLSGYYQWKTRELGPQPEPVCFDFSHLGPLAEARETFYEVGVDIERARQVLVAQLDNLEELARFAAARVASVVLDEPRAVDSQPFVAALDPQELAFAPGVWRERWAACAGSEERWSWRFDPSVIQVFDRTSGQRSRTGAGRDQPADSERPGGVSAPGLAAAGLLAGAGERPR